MWLELSIGIVNADKIILFDKDILLVEGQTVEGTRFTPSKEDYSILKNTLIKKERKTKSQPNEDLFKLFEELHTLTKGKGKVIFTPTRERKLKDLLGKHRLKREDLIRAATNIGNDEFLQGDNDRNKRYGDIDYLLRPDKAAKWAEEQAKKKRGMF